jgi:hypothetical protein
MPLLNKFKTLGTKLSRHSLITRDVETSSWEATPSEGILAFRTITTMLALIQEGTTFSDSKGHHSKEQSLELEILNALSTVIVRDVEVVAVTAKHNNGSGQFEVIACADLTTGRPGERLATSQPNISISEYLWSFLATVNIETLNGSIRSITTPCVGFLRMILLSLT